MKRLLTPIALAMNGATLAGLYLGNGEPMSEFAPATFAIVATVSMVALVSKAVAR
jgi:hypothetical protein